MSRDLRLLRRVRVRRAGVALELLQHLVAERALGQHALDGLLERAAGEALLHLREIGRRDAARVAAVAVVELVLGLVAGDAELLDVGDDDEVAGVHVRRVDGLVLAAQAQRDLARETAEDLVRGVDDEPVPLDFVRLGGKGFHGVFRRGWVNSAKSCIIIRICDSGKAAWRRAPLADFAGGGARPAIRIPQCGNVPQNRHRRPLRAKKGAVGEDRARGFHPRRRKGGMTRGGEQEVLRRPADVDDLGILHCTMQAAIAACSRLDK